MDDIRKLLRSAEAKIDDSANCEKLREVELGKQKLTVRCRKLEQEVSVYYSVYNAQFR